MLRWLFCPVFTVALLLSVETSASADRVKTLTKRLSKSSSSKVRMSAALGLAKSKDPRALRALISSLQSDRSSAIRRISASSLGQRLQTSPQVPNKRTRKSRKSAIAALTKAAKSDVDRKVRASAKVALAKVGAPTGRANRSGKRSGILVGVARPKRLSKRLPPDMAALMQSTVKQVIDEKAPAYIRTSAGSTMPSSRKLRQSGMTGYAVVPNVSKLSLVRRGSRVLVQCEVQLRLAPWNGTGETWVASKTATVTGSGTVTSGKSKGAISESSQQCISAVITQVTASKVVPFLATKAN